MGLLKNVNMVYVLLLISLLLLFCLISMLSRQVEWQYAFLNLATFPETPPLGIGTKRRVPTGPNPATSPKSPPCVPTTGPNPATSPKIPPLGIRNKRRVPTRQKPTTSPESPLSNLGT